MTKNDNNTKNTCDIEETIISIFSDTLCLPKEQITEEVMEDAIWESLLGYDIQLQIENHFHLHIEKTGLEIMSVKDLVYFIRETQQNTTQQKIQRKVLQNINSHTRYDCCTFYLSPQTWHTINNSHFENCSFRTDVIFSNLQDCTFSNCNFSNSFSLYLIPLLNLLKIPSYIFDLPQLTHLFIFEIKPDHKGPLNEDKLSDLVENYQFEKLTHKIKTISPQIAKLQALRSLELINIGLKKFPPSLLKLKNLNTLRLSQNNLKTVPPGIENMENLRQLDLSKNKISQRDQKRIIESLPECEVIF